MVKAMNPLTTYQRHHSIFHLRTCTTISLKFHDYFLLQVHLKILNCFFYGKKNFPMLRTPRAGHLRLPRRKKNSTVSRRPAGTHQVSSAGPSPRGSCLSTHFPPPIFCSPPKGETVPNTRETLRAGVDFTTLF